MRSLLVTILYSLLAGAGARADDSWWLGISGTPSAIRSHPTIRLEREDVTMVASSGRVRARFVFHNEGPATSVKMAFPESNKGLRKGQSSFKSFRTAVDGHTVRARRVPVNSIYSPYEAWWVKTVPFRRGQTRIVEVRYQSDPGEFNEYPGKFLEYVLTTGATWKGPIGRARIVCDISAIRHNSWPILAYPLRHRRTGDLLIWDLRDFEPRQEVRVEWCAGFLNVDVNGAPVAPIHGWHPNVWGRTGSGSQTCYLAMRRGNEVLATPETVDCWLKARYTKPAAGTYRFTRNGQWAEVKIGSPWMRTSRGRQRIAPLKVQRIEEWRPEEQLLLIPLSPVARALGGRATFIARHQKLYITLPRQSALAMKEP